MSNNILCGSCIHLKVCGMAECRDPRMTFCAYHEEPRTTAEWVEKILDNDLHIWECSECQHSFSGPKEVLMNGHYYCDVCGSEMVKVIEAIPIHVQRKEGEAE